MIDENDPLWFLKHNPRAYGEVKEWIEAKRENAQTSQGHCEVSNAYYNGYFFALDELLAELTGDLIKEAKQVTEK
jgi:hypothetical protein